MIPLYGKHIGMKIKKVRVLQAVPLLSYIVEKLDGVPVTLVWGSLLREYRNGTGPCVLMDFKDKDFDVAISESHFPAIVAMQDEIETKFGWVMRIEPNLIFLTISPMNQKGVNQASFQIDLYGFKIDYPKDGLVYFPRDNTTVAVDGFLPLVKHKSIASHNHEDLPSRSGKKEFYFYRPFNVPCHLANVYGPDYMTPKEGGVKDFDVNTAYDRPTCDDKALTDIEQFKLEQQKALFQVVKK